MMGRLAPRVFCIAVNFGIRKNVIETNNTALFFFIFRGDKIRIGEYKIIKINMHKVNTHKLGLVVGGFVGVVHIIWSLFVALGWAGPLLGFIPGLHFIDHPYMILPFNFFTAVKLVVIASCVGYVHGIIIGMLWNRVHSSK